MKEVYINHEDPLDQTCGVTELGYFRFNAIGLWGDSTTISDLGAPPGAGWFIAGFTNSNTAYQEAYEQLKKKYKIVYQSPVRINTRTGREFFFCIYDNTQKGE